ncbi:MAG: SEL1-like repeat protein, partial [Muribaculaceae bacterium]
ADAQFNLGFCYEHGHGVERNPTEAAHWYRMTAEQGHIEALDLINQLDDAN